MKIVCAWCPAVIKDGEGEETHGICPECYDRFLNGITPKTPLATFAKYIPHIHSGLELTDEQIKHLLVGDSGD